jgi:tetratricopeptide (TPR) repeat protein/tRNA A-37 threonylcarbamoyl transferase component Bud32
MTSPAGERTPTEALLDRALRTAFTTRGAPPKDLPPDASLPPERVCKVEAEIARGGMGVVYRARDPALGREVALKLLREDLAADDGAVRRFLEEARIGGRLQHPGVVPVYALGRTATGRPWFTMKLIEGRTFASMLQARASPSEDLRRHLAILESVCRTVAFAHDRGVVHLDLKPGNVMVGAFGEVQVVDWGLAALVRSSEPGTRPRSRDGAVYGTPAYMPPEQARGELAAIDERADVFALGAILCEMLTGAPPYAGGREASRRAAADAEIAGAVERLRACDTPDLAALCAECLQAAPERRRADAGGIAFAIARHFATLEERLRGAEVAAAEARTRAADERRARKLTLALAGSILLSIVIGAISWAWLSHKETLRRAGVDARARPSVEEATLLLGQAESTADLALFERASAAADRAQAALADGQGSPDLAASAGALLERIRVESSAASLRAERERSTRALLARLDGLRVPDDPGGELERDRAYADAFHAAGLDPDGSTPEAFAAEARARGVAVELAAAFDEWIDVREAACLPDGADRLRGLARILDADPRRSRLRAALARGSFDDLRRALEAVDLSQVAPGTIHAVDRALRARTLVGLWEIHVEDLYTRAIASHADDPTLAVELARLRFSRGDHAGGEHMYRVALALRPDHPTAYLEFAWELDHLDIDLGAAVGLFARAVELRPEDGLNYFYLGHALRRLGDLDGATAAQQEAVRRLPLEARPHKELAVILRQRGFLDEAIEELRRALAMYSGTYSIAWQEYADVLSERGRLDEALSELRAARTQNAANASEWGGVAARLLLDYGDYESAVHEMHRTLPAHVYAVLMLHERGVRMEDFLDLSGMEAVCERQVEKLPGDPTVHAQLGAVLEAEGRYSGALAEFRTAHHLGRQQQGWRHPSAAWLERVERWAELEIRMQRALDQHGEPRDADEAEAFARIAYRKGIFDASARWFAEALGTRKDRQAGELARLEAACAALRVAAASGQAGSVAWRARAQTWLGEDLGFLERRLGEGRPAAIAARKALGAWRVAPELADVREPARLGELPEAERAGWRELWDRASDLAARAADAVGTR